MDSPPVATSSRVPYDSAAFPPYARTDSRTSLDESLADADPKQEEHAAAEGWRRFHDFETIGQCLFNPGPPFSRGVGCAWGA